MTLLTLWRVGVVLLLGLASMGLWLRPPVRVQHVDCIETWKRMETLERDAQEKFVRVMLDEAAKLRAWEEPMAVMKQMRLRPLQHALAAAEEDRAAILARAEAERKEAEAGRKQVIAAAEAEIARRRDAVTQEERATYDRAEALAFLRARGIPLREHP